MPCNTCYEWPTQVHYKGQIVDCSNWNIEKFDKHVRIIIVNVNWEPNESTFVLLELSKKR
jgi:hypothetical protein